MLWFTGDKGDLTGLGQDKGAYGSIWVSSFVTRGANGLDEGQQKGVARGKWNEQGEIKKKGY